VRTRQAVLSEKLREGEDGFGLIEIVVAMFVLALLAISFLPILIQGLKFSAENASRATATQVVHDRIELAQSKSPSCVSLQTLAGTSVADVVDPRGGEFAMTTTVGACAAGARMVLVTTTVSNTGSGKMLATASTLVYVS
jgi:prepilin-type N-terminal cleavage/methylation domain-containing protein